MTSTACGVYIPVQCLLYSVQTIQSYLQEELYILYTLTCTVFKYVQVVQLISVKLLNSVFNLVTILHIVQVSSILQYIYASKAGMGGGVKEGKAERIRER